MDLESDTSFTALVCNPRLDIFVIKFEVEETDEYGYPIIAKDAAGDPIIKEVIPYDVPYLKKEVIRMIKHLKTNPKAYIKKK